MTKNEAEGVGGLIIIAVVVYPFVWLYEKIGAVGVGLCVFGLIAAFIYWHMLGVRQDQKAFDELVLYVLRNRMPPDEARKLNRKLSKENSSRAVLVRNLQIIRDSIEISLSSKKRATAESRAQSVSELQQEIQLEHSHLVSEDVYAEINRVCNEATSEFNTKLFVNIANGHIAKAQSLKTDKSKVKYLGLAAAALEEGIMIGRGDLAILSGALADVRAKQAEYT